MTFLSWLIVGFACSGAKGDSARVSVIADTSLQLHPSEVNFNSGASSVIRIKGNEHYMLMKFDLRPIEGWRVTQAALHLHDAHPNLLKTMGLSAVAADWQEGTGTSTEAPGGCTFTRAVWPDTYWAGPGSDFLDVALTNGNTLVRYTDIRREANDWFAVDVDPALMQALLCGDSFGLCLTDEKGQTRGNNDVHSREQTAFAPYLTVEGTRAEPTRPTLGPVLAEPHPAAAAFETGATRVRLTAPAAFRYEVEYAEKAAATATVLPRYRTPRPAPPGEEQSLTIPGLRPGAAYTVRVTAVDGFGNRSAMQSAQAVASLAKALPEPLPLAADETTASSVPAANGLRVWACPSECKVHPVSGNVLEEVGAERYGGEPAGAYRSRNPVWDGAAAHLAGARGEVVALQIVVEGEPRELSLRCRRARGRAGLPRPAPVYRNWYVRDGDWYAEYLVPLRRGRARLPAPDNRVPGQRNQAFTLLWEIPRNAAPGVKRGELVVGTDRPVTLPLRLEVHGFEIPARTSFEVDLNCYGPVRDAATWDEYLERERGYYAAAHALRATLNSLGYSHSGNMSRGHAPQIAGEGADLRVVDWSEYDRHWGPYLDGSAFGGVRAGVPLSHLYLPLHESWPTPIGGHYTGGNDLRKYPENIIAHALTAPAIEQAFDRTFQDAFVAATRQFAEHFRKRGWLSTDAQCYQNDKYYYKDEQSGFRGTSWWLLDEPMHRDDWLALGFLARLFRRGVRAAEEGPRFVFRGDISRPQFQRDWLDGCVDLMCVSSELFAHPQHCRRYREQGVALWHYGEANGIASSNLAAEAWALAAYAAGADGILPWNSIGGDSALDTPTPTALLIPGDRFGVRAPIVSLRVLALCRGQEDVEYLNLLARRKGYDRDQVARLLADSVTLRGGQQQEHPDDAGRVRFDRLRCEDFARLRGRLAAALR